MAIAKDVPHEMARLTAAAGVAEEVHEKTGSRSSASGRSRSQAPAPAGRVRPRAWRGVRFPPKCSLSDGRGAEADPTDGAFGSPGFSAAGRSRWQHARAATTAEIISANLEKMDPADAAAIRAAVAEAEAEAEVMERAERAGEALGSPPSSRAAAASTSADAPACSATTGCRSTSTAPALIPPHARSRARRRAATRRWRRKRRGDREIGTRRTTGTLPTCSRRSALNRKPLARARAAESASLAATDMSSPEAVAKLKHDLAVAGETVESLRTALAAIDVERDPGAAAAGPVARLAEQCRQMKPRVVALVESATDEGLLMAALALHDELGDVLDRRDAIAAAAAAEPGDARAALAASLAEEAARLALREGEERAPAAEKATDALVDLFGAPSSSQLPPAPTVDASLVDLLSPAETGASGRGSGSPAAGERESRGDGVGHVRRETLRRAGDSRRRRGTPRRPVRGVRSLRLVERRNRGYRATARTRSVRGGGGRRDSAPWLRRHEPIRGARPVRGGGERSGVDQPVRGCRAPAARGSGRSPRRLPGPRARRAWYRTRSSMCGTVRRARRWSEVRVRRAAAPGLVAAPEPGSAGGGRRSVRRRWRLCALAGEEPVRAPGSETLAGTPRPRVDGAVGEPSDVSSWGLG